MFYLNAAVVIDGAQPGWGTSDRAHLCSQLNILNTLCLTPGHPYGRLGGGTQISQPSLCSVH